jgi:CheY-like chemotaxis protein
MHILIVDDEPAIREMLAAFLEDEGHTTALAAEGQAALAYLQSDASRPDMILLDLMMPVLTGWEFLAAQRQQPDLASIPVILISATAQLRAERAEPPVRALIPKPIHFPTLFACLNQSA